MPPSLKKLAPLGLILVGSLGLQGCATKGFVREQVAAVNQRVDALDSRLQATDGTAKQALAEAQSASAQAQQNGQRLDQLGARVDGVEQKMAESQRKRPLLQLCRKPSRLARFCPRRPRADAPACPIAC